jgi:hypothetical protein
MKHLSHQHKHSILLEYQPYSRHHSFAALAARHGIAGGEQVIRKWHQAWKGTAASLEEKHRSGRPRILSRQQVQRYVAPPIRAANRRSQRVRYSDIHPSVEEKSGKSMSLQTLRRYGQKELGAHQIRGKKRTMDESKCKETTLIALTFACAWS